MLKNLRRRIGLLQGFGNAAFGGGQGIRLGLYVGGKTLRLGLNTLFPFFFKNYVEKTELYGLPQPKTFNSLKDMDIVQSFKKISSFLDYQKYFSDASYTKAYNMFMYSAMVKAYRPYKISSFENININRIWEYSFFNETFLDSVDKF